MKIVNIHEAKTNLSSLIQEALRGEEIIIANKNNPVVSLQPIIKPQKSRKSGQSAGKVKIIGDWKKGDSEVQKLFSY